MTSAIVIALAPALMAVAVFALRNARSLDQPYLGAGIGVAGICALIILLLI
jgi:hypothetical protein